MIYQEIVAVLKTHDFGKAIAYASANAFMLVELHNNGKTIDELVQLCLEHK